MSVGNPLLECAAQCEKKYHHMRCAGLSYMPRDWLCGGCVSAGVLQMFRALRFEVYITNLDADMYIYAATRSIHEI